MRTTMLFAALAVCALALPVAAAHIVFGIPVEQSDGSIRCEVIWIGNPAAPPHGVGAVRPCIPPSHNAQPTLP